MLRRKNFWFSVLSIFLVSLYPGCASRRINQVYVNPNTNFSFIKKVAVLPFENLTNDRFAGKKFRDVFVTALLATQSLEVPELGETMKVMEGQGIAAFPASSIPGQGIFPGGGIPVPEVKTDTISIEMAKSLGQNLGVQGIILGTVDEFDFVRSASGAYPEVAVTLRMLDPLTGSIVWSISHTEKGSMVLPSILGIGEESLNETAIKSAKKIVDTLIYK